MSTKTAKSQLRMYRGWHIERNYSSYFLTRSNSAGNSVITRRAKTFAEAKKIIDREEIKLQKRQNGAYKDCIIRGKRGNDER